METLTLQLVTWNGAAYLPHLFASLRAQTVQDWEIIVVDNGSRDGTVAALEQETARLAQRTTFVCNTENRGFAQGHNQAFARLSSAFVQLLNQDTVLAPDYLARCLACFATRERAAAVQGALCRWEFASNVCTDTVDTLGLRVLRSRRIVELGAGEPYQRAQRVEVFGISGALPMYRRAALIAVAEDGEILDEDFGSYKEDVDLAYRLRSAGWSAYCVPTARAWHDRSAAEHQRRRARSARERRYSYRNHLLMLMKNEHPKTFARDALPILGYELRKLLFVLIAEWGTARALLDLPRLIPVMLAKRRAIMARFRVEPKALQQWYA